MTASSKEAFKNPKNQRSYWTHRNICLNALKNEFGMTFREVANKTRLKQDSCWKRMSELHRDGKIKIIGEKMENGNWNSIYAIVTEPELFPNVKPPTFTKWAKEKHPEIWHEYEVLILHKL